jgi:hypothetical protein
MKRYRVRHGDDVLAEGDAATLNAAIHFMADTTRQRRLSRDSEIVLEALIGEAWERRITMHGVRDDE